MENIITTQEQTTVEVVAPQDKFNFNIIFNPSNLESCFLALVMKRSIKKDNVNIRMVPYKRMNNHLMSECNYFVIVNCSVYEEHLKQQIANVKKRKYSQSGTVVSYEGSYDKLSKEVAASLDILNPDSLSTWKTETMSSHEISLLELIRRYQNFEMMNVNELHSVFAVEQKIKTLAMQNGDLIEDAFYDDVNTIKPEVITGWQNTLEYIKTRISAVVEMRSYSEGMNSIKMISANIDEHYAHFAMRLISYPHKCFAVYEDLNGVRITRVYNETIGQESYISKFFDARDFWVEGKVTTVIGPVPGFKL